MLLALVLVLVLMCGKAFGQLKSFQWADCVALGLLGALGVYALFAVLPYIFIAAVVVLGWIGVARCVNG